VWSGLAADDTHVDPSLRGVSLVKSPVLRDEKCEMTVEYLNVRDSVMTVEQEAGIREVDCFLVCFDWANSDSIAAVEQWIVLAKRLSEEPTIFLVGTNFADLSPNSLPAKREQVDRIKTKHFCFKTFEVKQQFHQTIVRECALLKRMIAGDCATRREEIRRRVMFRPLESEPDWEFKVVG
jgi:hypothetical protein